MDSSNGAARGGVQQHRGHHPFGRQRGQRDDHPAAHRMTHEDGLAYAERVEGAQRQVDPVAQVGRIAGQVGGDAVAGRIEGDDQETHSRQPAQQSHVGPPAEGDAVQEHQRYTLAADGHAHLVPVVERDDLVGQPDPGSRGRLAGYRCLTHVFMVPNRALEGQLRVCGVGYGRLSARDSSRRANLSASWEVNVRPQRCK